MRLDEPFEYDSCYDVSELDDIYFDAQLEEIDTLYSELDTIEHTPIKKLYTYNYKHKHKHKHKQTKIENAKNAYVLYTMFNVCVVIAVYSTLITRLVYETFNIIIFQLISNQNNPKLHVS